MMTEEEKMARMEHSENIAKEFFKSLIAKKNDSKRSPDQAPYA